MGYKWKRKFDPSIILRKIQAVTIVNDDGSISVSDGFLDYQRALSALYSMIIFDGEAASLEKEVIINKALYNIVTKSTLSKQILLDEIQRLGNTELAVVPRKYHLLTSISLRDDFPIKTFKIGSNRVRLLGKEYPKKYLSRNSLIRNHSFNIKDETPTNYNKVIVSVEAKTEREASHQALRTIDFTRAIWCLIYN